MDAETKACLDLIRKIASEAQPPPGPIVLTSDYLRLVERVERLPMNAPGTEKGHVDRSDLEWRELHARIRRR